MPLRHRASLGLEALLWVAVLCLLGYLAYDIRNGLFDYLRVCGADSLHWAQGCPPRSLPWRSMLEFALFGLLVWWPYLRSRIKGGDTGVDPRDRRQSGPNEPRQPGRRPLQGRLVELLAPERLR
jgi:hypothetical protein